MSRLAIIPSSFFGIVLGVAGLGGTWRAANRLWHVGAVPGEALEALATIIWAILVLGYALKWRRARPVAVTEIWHPVQCCFVGLIGVTTMLIGLAALPYTRPLAVLLIGLGVVWTLAFGLWRTGLLWRGERDVGSTTPVLYLPLVAGSFVSAAGFAALGARDVAQMMFGAGFFAWLAIESVLLHRLYSGPAMPPPLRPTLGIQFAPPVVGAVAYMSVIDGGPGLAGHALLGYGVLQGLLLLRMLPWLLEAPLAPSLWAFSFGATALPTAAIRMALAGDGETMHVIAAITFAAANIIILALLAITVRLAVSGRLLPRG